MTPLPTHSLQPPDPASGLGVRAARLVSVQSLAWTAVASTAAVALGLVHHSVVLVAVGAIGSVDALGSAVLVHHFHRQIRATAPPEDGEHRAHTVVTLALFLVGLAVIVLGVARLVTGERAGRASVDVVVLAGVSMAVGAALAVRKTSIARRVESAALRSDGHLSLIGAAQAAVVLIGAAVMARWGWAWVDPAAAVLVGGTAVSVAHRARKGTDS